MTERLEDIQGHLDGLNDEGIKAALEVVISWPTVDQQLGGVRRRRRAIELLAQIDKSDRRVVAARRFLHSCATSDLGYQFLEVQDG